MTEFVEECRREWRRLGVPDPIANEMATDLQVDLDEAEAEGGSAEDVLGNSAFDPRRFAAAWARARGVTRPPTSARPSFERHPVAVALTVLLGALTIVAALALLAGVRVRSSAVSLVARAGSIFVPSPRGLVLPGPLRPFVGTQILGGDAQLLALLLLIVGVVGLGLLVVLYWSPWWMARRQIRNERRGSPSWN